MDINMDATEADQNLNNNASAPASIYRQLRFRHQASSQRIHFEVDNKPNYISIIFHSLLLQEQRLGQDGEKMYVEATVYGLKRNNQQHTLISKTVPLVYNPKQNLDEHAILNIPMLATCTICKLRLRLKLPQPSCSNECKSTSNDTEYTNELILSKGQIFEGIYEIKLKQVLKNPDKKFSWVCMPGGSFSNAKETMIKFYLTLSNKELPATIAASQLQQYTAHITASSMTPADVDYNHNNNNSNNNVTKIEYSFVSHNNNAQQPNNQMCPWCPKGFRRMDALLDHLRLRHTQITFEYGKSKSGTNIVVAVDDQPATSSSTRGCEPMNRSNANNQKKPKTDRVYYHSQTRERIRPESLDIDSENEHNSPWKTECSSHMLNQFVDVNEGEKEIMNLWNRHMERYENNLANTFMPQICEEFVKRDGVEILNKNLYRNFVLHMTNLFDNHAVSAETVDNILQKLQNILSKSTAAQEQMKLQYAARLKHWQEVIMNRAKLDTTAKSSCRGTSEGDAVNTGTLNVAQAQSSASTSQNAAARNVAQPRASKRLKTDSPPMLKKRQCLNDANKPKTRTP